MNKSVADWLAAADAVVPRIGPDDARLLLAEQNALVIDVREAAELHAGGKVAGAVHVPRGVLEFKADPASPLHDTRLRRDRPLIVYCAVGGRSALAGATLREMGYTRVFNLGGFQDWVDAGGEVEPAGDAA